MTFAANDLLQQLQQFAPLPRRYVVALSGGCDSVVLLHALVSIRNELGVRLTAIHINHQLHRESGHWQRFCEERCRLWSVPIECETVEVSTRSGKGIEAAARSARYAVFARQLEETDVLLMAHHADDQVETLLLNLFNGAGVDGLAGMPRSRALGRGQLLRPLLGVDRTALRDYAQQHSLEWIEDPSNDQQNFDRNFVRHSLLPLIESRFPSASQAIARSARLCRSASSQLSADTARLLPSIVDPAGRLLLEEWRDIERFQQDLLLRAWASGLGVVLNSRHLQSFRQDLIDARQDASPGLKVGGGVFRRFRHTVYFAPEMDISPVNPGEYSWTLDGDLYIEALGLLLEPQTLLRLTGLSSHDTVNVRFRRGGERFLPLGERHSRSLKTLFQRWDIPPWRRHEIPLIFWENELILIYGYAVASGALPARKWHAFDT